MAVTTKLMNRRGRKPEYKEYQKVEAPGRQRIALSLLKKYRRRPIQVPPSQGNRLTKTSRPSLQTQELINMHGPIQRFLQLKKGSWS